MTYHVVHMMQIVFTFNIFFYCMTLIQFVTPALLTGAVMTSVACEDGAFLQPAPTVGSACDCCVAAVTRRAMHSEDNALRRPVPMPRIWHRLGKGMRCILFVFI